MSNDFWYGPLQIDMQRHKPLKRKNPMRRISLARAARNIAYRSIAIYFLSRRPLCEMVAENGTPCCLKDATQIHHMKGRSGSLLCDTRYFLPVCQDHHRWIEDNKKEARKRGLILYQ